ncbi:SRPBCC family protein [Marinigracilibium pacificum]|uniref:SRPBCC domain-containing protein n=1 Tax=Marinigracilibium pacificum TaxID=2729599 RepID=A0A848IWD9_9BACT|nr:SRPBCC domain-containing protein [Marinigracilibium pacificum]NMM47595.1 SRPBCC domain-containing protein [Marinigracilibium pacificum]
MSNKKQFDYSHFTVKSVVQASVHKVYELWTSQAGLEKWFLRLAEFTSSNGEKRDPHEDIQVGDTYKWLWHGYPDTVVEHGEILELNGKNHMRFTFGKAGIVTVTIGIEESTTIVTLTQDNIPPVSETEVNFHVDCKTGWTFYLANMNSIVQGGVDLRNKNTKLHLD